MPDPTRQRQWRFYGREAEIARLRTRLQLDDDLAQHEFAAFGITGRRGVGKNFLLDETIRRHGGHTRFLLVDMDDTTDVAIYRRGLEAAIRDAGLTHVLNAMPEDDETELETRRFTNILFHLVKHDVIVCLDEFHHARTTPLPNAIKVMIDRLRRRHVIHGEALPPGKLICMGSHQQEFRSMFTDTSPLHLRMKIEMTLRPWTPATVMTMARDQGWDRHPARLHTLWTAYDGMPYLWERLATDPTIPETVRNWAISGNGPDPDAEAAWREAFIEQERRLLNEDERLSWDHRAIIELKEPLREAFLCMGQVRSAGHMMPTPVIARTLNRARREASAPTQTLSSPALHRRLLTLERDTGLIEHRGFFTGLHKDDTGSVWTISDNMTLFQIRALTYGVKTPDSPVSQTVARQQARQRMEGLEGEMMERFGALWLTEHPHCEWSYAAVLPPRPKTGAARDIDILARFGPGEPNDLLVLGNAKRDSAEHDPEDFVDIIEAFMAQAEDDENIRTISTLPRCLMAVSPAFAERDVTRLEEAGMLCFDLATMHAELEGGWPRLNERMHPKMQPISGRGDPPLFCGHSKPVLP